MVEKHYNIYKYNKKLWEIKMPKNVNKEVQEFIKQVKKLLGIRLKRIILYESYARGDYNSQSDVDMMTLTDLSSKEIEEYRDKISDIAYDIELSTGIIISPVIKNIEKYNSRINFVPFYKNVEKEVVILENG